MRLPFGLGRRSSSGDGAENGDSDTGPATADASSTPAAPGRAWASLPPIQRTAGDMPMVAEPGRFAGALPGSQGLPPIVQPLGHEVSALATPGLVVARVRPVEVASTAAIPAPVQRRPASSSRPASVQAIAAPAAPEIEEPIAAEAPAAAAAHPTLEVQPIRTMPTVSRQSVHVPDRPLTSAAMAARPAAVQRAEAAAAAASADPLPPSTSGGMRRVPSGAPAAMPVVSRQAAAPQAGTPQPAVVQPATAQPAPTPAPTTSAAPTRLGLGEPLSSVPASARPVGAPGATPLVSRSTTAGPMPLATSNLRPTAQRSSAAGSSPNELPALGPAAGAPLPPSTPRTPGQPVAQRLPALPHLPVTRPSVAQTSAAHSPAATSPARTSPAASAASPSGGSAAASIGATASVSAASGPAMPLATAVAPRDPVPTRAVQTSAAPEIRPIAAANPIRPSFVIQRAADDAGDEGHTPDAVALPSPWWAPAAESQPANRGFGGAGFDAAPPSIQRSAGGDAGSAGGTSSYPWTAGAGPSPSGALAQSIQRSSSPASRPLPPARGAVADAGTRSAATAASAAAASTLSSTPAMSPAVGITSGPVVQTSPTAAGQGGRSVVFGQGPTVQRMDPPSPGAERPSGGQPAGGSPGGQPAAAQPGGGQSRAHSDRDLDELAQALFSRIRTRLRSDLIHDREAKGLTFDNV